MGATSSVRTGSRDPTTPNDCEIISGGSETDGGRDEVGGREDTPGGDGADENNDSRRRLQRRDGVTEPDDLQRL